MCLFFLTQLFAQNPKQQIPIMEFKNIQEIVKCPQVTFQMGSSDCEYDLLKHEIQHEVTLNTNFEIQTTEVTQIQWFLIMKNNPSRFKYSQYCDSPKEGGHVYMDDTSLCQKLPVESVSWNDVEPFIRTLNLRMNDGYEYRLPTEAEWEFVTRGGAKSPYSFGNHVYQSQEFAWTIENSAGQPHAVATKKPNPYGLYDLHGNVWEWVSDWFKPYAPSKVINPLGPLSGFWKVIRGGGWNNYAYWSRSALRTFSAPYLSGDGIGFRLVRTKKPSPIITQ